MLRFYKCWCLCYSHLHIESVLRQQEATLLGDEKKQLEGRFSPEHLAVLRRYYAEDQRPCENTFKELAFKLHVPIGKVKKWFSYKRSRSKRRELTNELLGETL